jgi:hypothetical protein
MLPRIESREPGLARAVLPLPQGDLEPAIAVEQRDPAHLALFDILRDEFEIKQRPVPRGAAPQVGDRQFDMLDLAQPDAHAASYPLGAIRAQPPP